MAWRRSRSYLAPWPPGTRPLGTSCSPPPSACARHVPERIKRYVCERLAHTRLRVSLGPLVRVAQSGCEAAHADVGLRKDGLGGGEMRRRVRERRAEVREPEPVDASRASDRGG